jgi:hypothetical protein
MALEDLTEFDKIVIGAALLFQLQEYKANAANNSRKTGDPDWDNYWDDRVKETIETINRFQPGLLDRD